jgi:hypothetical protein
MCMPFPLSLSTQHRPISPLLSPILQNTSLGDSYHVRLSFKVHGVISEVGFRVHRGSFVTVGACVGQITVDSEAN